MARRSTDLAVEFGELTHSQAAHFPVSRAEVLTTLPDWRGRPNLTAPFIREPSENFFGRGLSPAARFAYRAERRRSHLIQLP